MASANRINKKAQPEKSFRTSARVRLAQLDLNVTELAKRLSLARNTVSIAINHETMLPGVKDRIRKYLGI